MKPLVTQLWPQFAADETFARGFAGVLVERVELLRQSQKAVISLRSAQPLDSTLCERLCVSLAGLFAGYTVGLRNLYPFESLTEAAVRELIFELREEGLPVNGFLDRAGMELKEGRLTLHLAAGKGLLEELEFPERLACRIAERTGTKPEVVLEGCRAMPQKEWEAHIRQKAPAAQFEQKKAAPALKIPGLPLTDTPARLVYGKAFKPGGLTPLGQLGPESGKVTVWGDVFASEV